MPIITVPIHSRDGVSHKEYQQGNARWGTSRCKVNTYNTSSHPLYADDLVVMGLAEVSEVEAYMSIFENFGRYSGLEVNPEKSTLWFSKRCSERQKNDILLVMNARVAGDKERYLGVVLSQGKLQQTHTGELLVHKFHEKLAGWKINLLSHAGRTVLIKSILTSVPVYYMSVEKLSRKTIDELEGIMRKFMWGKKGKDRYMAMVAWHKICVGLEEGVLGIKSIEVFNKAFIQKLIWQLAVGI